MLFLGHNIHVSRRKGRIVINLKYRTTVNLYRDQIIFMANLYIAIALYRPTVADTTDDQNIKMNLSPDTWPGSEEVLKKKGQTVRDAE